MKHKPTLVYIVGNQGNMARRYSAILDYLEIPFCGHDKAEYNPANNGKNAFLPTAKCATHFIICTPTERHLKDIGLALHYEKPILCEKPLTTNALELQAFERDCGEDIALVSMVNQYRFLGRQESEGATYYDYFKTGNDGLAWDCLNIIGLAKKAPTYIKNESPVWRCSINGRPLDLGMVDYAYISMIRDFLSPQHKSNWAYAYRAHEKVEEWLKS